MKLAATVSPDGKLWQVFDLVYLCLFDLFTSCSSDFLIEIICSSALAFKLSVEAFRVMMVRLIVKTILVLL